MATRPGELHEIIYEDDSDRKQQQWLQDHSLSGDEQRRWTAQRTADNVMASEWSQVLPEQLDVPVSMVVGRCEGDLRNVELYELSSVSGRVVGVCIPMVTQFVRVVLGDGTEAMEAYDPDRHGLWDDIPDIGLSPSELLEQLWGFGDTQVEQGWQFQLARKGGASRVYCPTGHHPQLFDRTPIDY
jgi:hypothetical protein